MPVSLRAQKNVVSRLARPFIVQSLLDRQTVIVVQALRKLTEIWCTRHGERIQRAAKLEKHMMKIGMKLGVLHLNDCLESEQDQENLTSTMLYFTDIIPIVITAVNVGSITNYPALEEKANAIRTCMKSVVSEHMTQKSVERLDSIFDFYVRREFLDDIVTCGLKADSPYREPLQTLISSVIRQPISYESQSVLTVTTSSSSSATSQKPSSSRRYP